MGELYFPYITFLFIVKIICIVFKRRKNLYMCSIYTVQPIVYNIIVSKGRFRNGR